MSGFRPLPPLVPASAAAALPALSGQPESPSRTLVPGRAEPGCTASAVGPHHGDETGGDSRQRPGRSLQVPRRPRRPGPFRPLTGLLGFEARTGLRPPTAVPPLSGPTVEPFPWGPPPLSDDTTPLFPPQPPPP